MYCVISQPKYPALLIKTLQKFAMLCPNGSKNLNYFPYFTATSSESNITVCVGNFN